MDRTGRVRVTVARILRHAHVKTSLRTETISDNRPADIVKCLVVIGGKEGLRQYEGPCVMIGSLWDDRVTVGKKDWLL